MRGRTFHVDLEVGPDYVNSWENFVCSLVAWKKLVLEKDLFGRKSCYVLEYSIRDREKLQEK